MLEQNDCWTEQEPQNGYLVRVKMTRHRKGLVRVEQDGSVVKDA